MAPTDKVGSDGWVVVGSAKKKDLERRKKEREEKARLEAIEAAKKEKNQTAFSAFIKDDDSPQVQKKKAQDEAKQQAAAAKLSEKEAQKKHMKKVDREKAKARQQTTKQSSPKSQLTFARAAAEAPEDLKTSLAEIPKKYPGRVKDQFYTAAVYLNDVFNADVVISTSYKSLSHPERWAHPKQGLVDDKSLLKSLHKLIDGANDDQMWNATLRDCLLRIFGSDGGRVDEGRHFLGTRLLVQVLLQHRPEAFAVRPDAVESLFVAADGSISDSAAANYAWVLAQIPSRGACEAVASWANVYARAIVEEEGKHASNLVSALGVDLSTYFATLTPSLEVKQAYHEKTKGEPVPANLLYSCLEQCAPKKSRNVKLVKSVLPAYSALFLPSTPGRHFGRVAQLLRASNEVSRPLMLDILIESIVLGQGDVFMWWTNGILPIVKETAVILEEMSKREKYLSTRANGMEVEKFFDHLGQKCRDIQSGKLVPTAKQAKRCNYTAEDVAAILSRLGKVAGLAKALPTDAAVSAKQAKKLNKHIRERNVSGGGFGFTSFIMLLLTLALVFYLALPFLPPPVQAQVKDLVEKHGRPVVEKVMPHVKALLAQK